MIRCPDPPSPVRQDFERVALAIIAAAMMVMLLSGCMGLYLPYGLLTAPVVHGDGTGDKSSDDEPPSP